MYSQGMLTKCTHLSVNLRNRDTFPISEVSLFATAQEPANSPEGWALRSRCDPGHLSSLDRSILGIQGAAVQCWPCKSGYVPNNCHPSKLKGKKEWVCPSSFWGLSFLNCNTAGEGNWHRRDSWLLSSLKFPAFCGSLSPFPGSITLCIHRSVLYPSPISAN